MANIIKGRKTVIGSEDMIVFILGARVNKWWLLPISLPILSRMTRMLEELGSDPNSGLLGYQSLGFGTVQYWRSTAHLLAYANATQKTHKSAAKSFWRKLFKNEAVGLWHELYAVPRGHYEGFYVNMPKLGLGKVAPLLDVTGERARTEQRLSETALRLGSQPLLATARDATARDATARDAVASETPVHASTRHTAHTTTVPEAALHHAPLEQTPLANATRPLEGLARKATRTPDQSAWTG
jgi:hypothetical protein